MARSQLYRGRDKDDLSPAERQLEELYDRVDRPGNRLTDTQFFQTPEATQLLDRIYGSLGDRLPPGSQIVSQTPGKITYRDAEGFEHNLIRKPDGQFTETTNRPAIVPTAASRAQEGFATDLQQRLQQSFDRTGLAQLDPETAAALQAISASEQGAIDQQLGDAEAQLLARLFGNRVNQSSIATNAGARFAQQGGLVRQQQRSDAATRQLGLQQFLTNLMQEQQGVQAGLYSNLTGQGTQRDIAGAGLEAELKRLTESSRQFDETNYLQQLQTQLERDKFQAANSPFRKVLDTINAVSGVASGVGGGLGAYRALTKG